MIKSKTEQMKNWLLPGAFILFLCFAMLLPLAVYFTLAGSSTPPNATVTYTEGKLEWDLPTDGGVADLNLFGEPEEGETNALIHPLSKGDYRLRIQNGVPGRIGYRFYLYCENPHDIPLVFDVSRTPEMFDVTEAPAELAGMNVLSSFGGYIEGHDDMDIDLNWYWDSESDEADTALGTAAATEDLTYTIHVMIVIEDNNAYIDPTTPPTSTDGSSDAGVRMYHYSYMTGYPDQTFRPEISISRAEMATVIAQLIEGSGEDILTDLETGYSDVHTSDWHAKYIALVEKLGLMSGYLDGTFEPNKAITRAEFISVVVRYAEYTYGPIEDDAFVMPFPDVPADHWAREAIRKGAARGLIVGYPDGSYRPDDPITRAEAVTIINALLNRYADESFIDEEHDHSNALQFTDVPQDHWAYYQIVEATSDHYTTSYEDREEWQGSVDLAED